MRVRREAGEEASLDLGMSFLIMPNALMAVESLETCSDIAVNRNSEWTIAPARPGFSDTSISSMAFTNCPTYPSFSPYHPSQCPYPYGCGTRSTNGLWVIYGLMDYVCIKLSDLATVIRLGKAATPHRARLLLSHTTFREIK